MIRLERLFVRKSIRSNTKIKRGTFEVVQVRLDEASVRNGIYSGRVRYFDGKYHGTNWRARRISGPINVYPINGEKFHEDKDCRDVIESAIILAVEKYEIFWRKKYK